MKITKQENLVSKQENLVTKQDFESYKKVQDSGVTNIFAIQTVSDISDLSYEKVLYIMEHYDEVANKR